MLFGEGLLSVFLNVGIIDVGAQQLRVYVLVFQLGTAFRFHFRMLKVRMNYSIIRIKKTNVIVNNVI